MHTYFLAIFSNFGDFGNSRFPAALRGNRGLSLRSGM
jgi:hypothetical protein